MSKRHKITHSDDATTITIEGDIHNPEPAYAIIKFPGGHVEVTRCTDGTYWAHLAMDDGDKSSDVAGSIIDSRVEYTYEGWIENGGKILDVPHADKLKHLAVRIKVQS